MFPLGPAGVGESGQNALNNNFSDVEQDQRVKLPASELAQPPTAPYEHAYTIHLTSTDRYIFGGRQWNEIAQQKDKINDLLEAKTERDYEIL